MFWDDSAMTCRWQWDDSDDCEMTVIWMWDDNEIVRDDGEIIVRWLLTMTFDFILSIVHSLTMSWVWDDQKMTVRWLEDD